LVHLYIPPFPTRRSSDLKYLKQSRAIRFEGNGYSKEWEIEAENRGLSNIKTTPKALDVYTSDKSLKLFESLGILNRRESHARHEILLESYFKKIQIEARVIGEIVNSMLAPASITYLNELVENVKGLKDFG